ncbi:MAG: HD-GYP domain-containing protein [Bacillota bacterium]
MLHDIGKLEISDTILTKPARLTDEEMRIMTAHAELGAQILARTPVLADLSGFVHHHHEWYNGRGYPTGLAGEEIPWVSRLISICDAFDTMVTPRPYASSLSTERALEELERCAGTQFDPSLAERFVALARSGVIKRWSPIPADSPAPARRPEPLAIRLSVDQGHTIIGNTTRPVEKPRKT